MIVENLRAWVGYRKAQVRLGGKDDEGTDLIPTPRPFRASLEEGSIKIAMLLAAVGFCVFNPFLI
jgi:hypothetical protein